MKKVLTVAISAVLALCGLSAAADAGVTLTVEDKAVPEEIDAEVRDGIAPKSYQLSDADGLFFEFWFVPEITVTKMDADAKKTLENMEGVALVGAMIVHRAERHDFRDDPIDPGTYVLRASLQPQDGNHMGTSMFDTFAILIRADMDALVREFPDHEEMVDIASEDTPAEHPPILAFQPMADGAGDFPRLEENEEEEWKFMCMKFTARAGGETMDIPVHVVIEGIGDIE